jgi:signal transduction histidine kinase
MTITPVLDAEGSITHYVAIKLDITRRRADEAALTEAEQRHRLAIDAAELGTWRHDVVNDSFQLSDRARQHLNVSASTVTLADVLASVAPGDVARVRSAIGAAYDPSGSGRTSVECAIVGPSRQEHRITVHARVHFAGTEADRSARFAIGTTRDVTKERETEEQLRAAQRMEAIGRLAGGVAHDFNNILGVILSYAELASEDLRPEDPLRADLNEIEQAAHRATALTRQLLAFSRRQVLEPEDVDLGQVVDALGKMLQRLIGEDVLLQTNAAPDLFVTWVDRGQIEQVLMNLAVNARDAMPGGGELRIRTANVRLSAARAAQLEVAAGDYVELAVSDTGSGMDEALVSRIFEPFFTTKPVGKGTGLGLSMVHGIVRQSGGGIAVDSVVGRGSTFHVYLPRHSGDSLSRPSQATERHGTGGYERILVVEDEASLRGVIKRVLSSAGYNVTLAANAGEALLLCEQSGRAFDLLLTDVVMPGMHGPELVRRLAQLCPTSVLFMSGYNDEMIENRGLDGVPLLRKPFDRATLGRAVRAALDAR